MRAAAFVAKLKIEKLNKGVGMMKLLAHKLTCSHRALQSVLLLSMMAPLLILSACCGLGAASDSVSASTAGLLGKDQIAAIIASPDRSAADRSNDLRRKPDQMLAFIGVRPGLVALDLSTGGGYTTELLARATGPGGRAYGQSQPPRPAGAAPGPSVAPEGNSAPQLPLLQPTAGAAPQVPRRSSAQALAEPPNLVDSALCELTLEALARHAPGVGRRMRARGELAPVEHDARPRRQRSQVGDDGR